MVKPADDTSVFATTLWAHKDRLHAFYLENQHDPRGEREGQILTGPLIQMTCDGSTWTKPREIVPPQEVAGRLVSSSTVNKPIVLKSGRIVMPIQFTDGVHRLGACCGLISDDDGHTWRMSKRVPSDQKMLMEPTVVESPDGRLIMYIRNEFDFPVIWRSASEDQGETWSPAEPAPLRNWAKTYARKLQSGQYIMMFNDVIEPASDSALHRRRNLAIAISENAIDFQTLGHIDTESNGLGISYPSCIEHDGLLYSVASRRTSPDKKRPNMVRGQITRLNLP